MFWPHILLLFDYYLTVMSLINDRKIDNDRETHVHDYHYFICPIIQQYARLHRSTENSRTARSDKNTIAALPTFSTQSTKNFCLMLAVHLSLNSRHLWPLVLVVVLSAKKLTFNKDNLVTVHQIQSYTLSLLLQKMNADYQTLFSVHVDTDACTSGCTDGCTTGCKKM